MYAGSRWPRRCIQLVRRPPSTLGWNALIKITASRKTNGLVMTNAFASDAA